MTGSRKKVLITVIVIAAVVAAGIIGFLQLRDMAQTGVSDVPDTIVLRKTDLESKVTASGNFASRDPVSVGSNALAGEVAYVYIEEGDKVYKGDVLARLKTSDIERSISDMKSAISDLSRGDRQKLEAAQRAVDDAQAQYDSDNYWTQRDINDAEAKLKSAKAALNAAKAALADYIANPPGGVIDPDEQAILQQAVDAAQAAVDQAGPAIDQAKRVRESTLRASSSRLTEARAQLDSLYGMDSARQSRTQLESLNEELANSAVISPITGIVTRVLTEEGQPAMGTMFMIEDTETLQIKANVAEFDIIKIEEGMQAHIRSNATGSETYNGIVEFVAPVAADASGNFAVHVLLTSPVGQLKPGMTATVEIVLAAKRDIFAVPIDAVVTKPDGTKAVYVYEPGAIMQVSGGPVGGAKGEPGGGAVDGSGERIGGGPVGSAEGGPVMIQDSGDGPVMITGPGGGAGSGPGGAGDGGNRREIIVKTGMETDFYIEIISDELTEGMLIVADPMGRNVSVMGSGPMMMGPGGGMAVGAAPARSEGTVTVVAD